MGISYPIFIYDFTGILFVGTTSKMIYFGHPSSRVKDSLKWVSHVDSHSTMASSTLTSDPRALWRTAVKRMIFIYPLVFVSLFLEQFSNPRLLTLSRELNEASASLRVQGSVPCSNSLTTYTLASLWCAAHFPPSCSCVFAVFVRTCRRYRLGSKFLLANVECGVNAYACTNYRAILLCTCTSKIRYEICATKITISKIFE